MLRSIMMPVQASAEEEEAEPAAFSSMQPPNPVQPGLLHFVAWQVRWPLV